MIECDSALIENKVRINGLDILWNRNGIFGLWVDGQARINRFATYSRFHFNGMNLLYFDFQMRIMWNGAM